MANPFITVLLSWFILGLLWAALYDTINNTIPAQFPVGMSESNSTWCVLQWIWNISTVIIGLNIGIAAMRPGRNQYGQSISGPVLTGFIVFVSWTTIIMVWAIFYNPIFHVIPSVFAAFSTAEPPAFLLTSYNGGCILMTVGLGIGMFARNT